jgi:hypothetical protein
MMQQHSAAALFRGQGRDVSHRRLVQQQALVHVQHMFCAAGHEGRKQHQWWVFIDRSAWGNNNNHQSL